MAVTTIWNTIANPENRRMIEGAVTDEIGDRSGDWRLYLTEKADQVGWTVRITGPDGFVWSRHFFGEEEQDPRGEFIRKAVKAALP